MKPSILSFSWSASLKKSNKLIIFFIVLFALVFSPAINADAQRHSGFGHSGSEHIGLSGRILVRSFGGLYLHGPYYPFWGGFYGFFPFATLSFIYGGLDYYLYNGIYYRNIDGKYAMVPAPIGYRVKKLPNGYEEFTLDSIAYFYYNGSFYVQKGKKFEVVQAPVGAIVQHIPIGYQKEVVNGETYYIVYGVQYKVVVRDNVICYLVIKSEGANSKASPPNKK
jgi:hypothetical protein